MKITDVEGAKRNEADVAAEFAHLIRSDGRLDVRMEVSLPSRFHRSKRFRVDALIVKRDEILCALEFKKPGKRVGARTRQREAYADLPFPHFYVVGRHGIKRILPLVFALAGFNQIEGAFDTFGKSAISRSGNIKGRPAYINPGTCNQSDFRGI